MKRSPLQEVKERFTDKENLVKELAPMLSKRDEESDGEFRSRLQSASNAKLLHLHKVETELRDRFGTREKLVDAICHMTFADKKVDQDYRGKLLTLSSARLMDRHRALARH